MSFLSRMFAQMKLRAPARSKAIVLLIVLLFGFSIAVSAYAQTPAPAGGSTVDSSISSFSTTQWLNYIPATLGYIFAGLAWGIGKLIILVLGWVIIPILGYNEFAHSNMVSIGWALVRDIVNMFVIVILLLIALQTMFGVGRVDWRQQLPKLFLAVVAVNFSKTITLFLIDIGQVVMFTFVNALKDIAAGNFTNLFQINAFMSLSENEQGVTGIAASGGYNAIGFMASAYLTLALLSMVLIVLLMLALVFIYRIVVLWILIIVSPIAFFAGGVGNTISSFGSQYADWWKRVVGAVALGPIMTFFLWLALAAASQGAIATSEGFDTGTSEEAGAASTIYNQWADPEAFLSILLAMVIIVVGFQAASSQASALGGPAASFFTEGMGQRLLKGAAAAPAALGYAGARGGYRGVKAGGGAALASAEYRLGGTRFAGLRPSELTGMAARAVSGLREVSPGGVPIGRMAAWATGAGAASAAATKGVGSLRTKQIQAAQEKAKALGDTQRFQEYDDIGANRTVMVGGTDKRIALAGKLATDKNEQKAYKESLKERGFAGPELDAKLSAAIASSLKVTEANKDALIGDDKAKQESFYKAQVANAHLLETDSKSSKADKIKKLVEDDAFKTSMLSKDAVSDPEVEAALRARTREEYDFKTQKRTDVSLWDDVVQGKGISDSGVRQVASEKERDRIAQLEAGRGTGVDRLTSPSEIADALAKKTLRVEDISADQIRGARGADIVQGSLDAADRGADLSGMTDAARTEFMSRVGDPNAITDPAQRARARKALYSATSDPSHLGVNEDGTFQSGGRLLVSETIKNRPEAFADFIPEGVPVSGLEADALTNEAIKATSSKAIADMARKFNSVSAAEQGKIKRAVQNFKMAMDAEKRRDNADADKIAAKDLRDLDRAISQADRYIS